MKKKGRAGNGFLVGFFFHPFVLVSELNSWILLYHYFIEKKNLKTWAAHGWWSTSLGYIRRQLPSPGVFNSITKSFRVCFVLLSKITRPWHNVKWDFLENNSVIVQETTWLFYCNYSLNKNLMRAIYMGGARTAAAPLFFCYTKCVAPF